MTFGDRLKQLRKKMALTQRQTAARLGCNLQNYRQWERDYVSPRLNTIFRIADYYKMTVSTLLKGVNEVSRGTVEEDDAQD